MKLRTGFALLMVLCVTCMLPTISDARMGKEAARKSGRELSPDAKSALDRLGIGRDRVDALEKKIADREKKSGRLDEKGLLDMVRAEFQDKAKTPKFDEAVALISTSLGSNLRAVEAGRTAELASGNSSCMATRTARSNSMTEIGDIFKKVGVNRAEVERMLQDLELHAMISADAARPYYEQAARNVETWRNKEGVKAEDLDSMMFLIDNGILIAPDLIASVPAGKEGIVASYFADMARERVELFNQAKGDIQFVRDTYAKSGINPEVEVKKGAPTLNMQNHIARLIMMLDRTAETGEKGILAEGQGELALIQRYARELKKVAKDGKVTVEQAVNAYDRAFEGTGLSRYSRKVFQLLCPAFGPLATVVAGAAVLTAGNYFKNQWFGGKQQKADTFIQIAKNEGHEAAFEYFKKECEGPECASVIKEEEDAQKTATYM